MPLDFNYELKKVDDNHYAVEMSITEMALNNYVYQLEEKLEAELLDKCERKLNELGWYKKKLCKVTHEYGTGIHWENHWIDLSCHHTVFGDPDWYSYCPECGAKVLK